MRRRQFLLTAGGIGTVAVARSLAGSGGDRTATSDGPRRASRVVRVVLSERAASYDDVYERVVGYLGRALSPVYSATFERGPDVPLDSENAYDAMTSLAWPERVARDAATSFAMADVNLLVTDGEMERSPTGMGIPHLAAVGGARLLARLPPVEETATVVAYSDRFRAAQVLVHEVGHALGLHHDHGSIARTGDVSVVSPMVSTYPWAPPAVRRDQFDVEANACGDPYPDVTGSRARLKLTYSPCARRYLRGDVAPSGQ